MYYYINTRILGHYTLWGGFAPSDGAAFECPCDWVLLQPSAQWLSALAPEYFFAPECQVAITPVSRPVSHINLKIF